MNTSQSLPPRQLSGTDGNVFAVIGKVSAALKKAKLPERAAEFTGKAFQCESYDDVLALCMKWIALQRRSTLAMVIL